MAKSCDISESTQTCSTRCHVIGQKECCSAGSARSCLEMIICSQLQFQDLNIINKVVLSVLELNDKQSV